MKKIFSVLLVATFLSYAVYVRQFNQTTNLQPLAVIDQPFVPSGSTGPIVEKPTTTSLAATPPPTPTPKQNTTPPPAPPKQLAMYRDGTFTGNSIDAYYGFVQVAAVIQNGKLTNVQMLDYPRDQSTSREINSQALPILISEAIKKQDANIRAVSGASETSPAFKQSLASALAQAKN